MGNKNKRPDKNERNKTKRLWAWVTPETKELLRRQAAEEGRSASAVLGNAINMYLAKDFADEELVLAKLGGVECLLKKTSCDLDMTLKLLLEYMRYFFLFAPTIASDEVSVKLQRADKDVRALLRHFNQRMPEINALEETLFGETSGNDKVTT